MGGATMAARKQASGVWEKGLASPPIADALTALDHTRERKIEGGGRKGQDAEDVVSALLTYAMICSVAGSRRAPPPPVPVAVTAFKPCKLTMRAEHGVCALLKRTWAFVIDGPREHWPLLDGRRDLHHSRSRTPLLCRASRGVNLKRGRSRLGVRRGSTNSRWTVDMGGRDCWLGTAPAACGILTSTWSGLLIR